MTEDGLDSSEGLDGGFGALDIFFTGFTSDFSDSTSDSEEDETGFFGFFTIFGFLLLTTTGVSKDSSSDSEDDTTTFAFLGFTFLTTGVRSELLLLSGSLILAGDLKPTFLTTF